MSSCSLTHAPLEVLEVISTSLDTRSATSLLLVSKRFRSLLSCESFVLLLGNARDRWMVAAHTCRTDMLKELLATQKLSPNQAEILANMSGGHPDTVKLLAANQPGMKLANLTGRVGYTYTDLNTHSLRTLLSLATPEDVDLYLSLSGWEKGKSSFLLDYASHCSVDFVKALDKKARFRRCSSIAYTGLADGNLEVAEYAFSKMGPVRANAFVRDSEVYFSNSTSKKQLDWYFHHSYFRSLPEEKRLELWGKTVSKVLEAGLTDLAAHLTAEGYLDSPYQLPIREVPTFSPPPVYKQKPVTDSGAFARLAGARATPHGPPVFKYFHDHPVMHRYEAMRLYRDTLVSCYYLARQEGKDFPLKNSYFVHAVNTGDLCLAKWLYSKGCYTREVKYNLGCLALATGSLEMFLWLEASGYNMSEVGNDKTPGVISRLSYATVISNYLSRTGDAHATALMLRATAPYRCPTRKFSLSKGFTKSLSIEDVRVLVDASFPPADIAIDYSLHGNLVGVQLMYASGTITLSVLRGPVAKRIERIHTARHILCWIRSLPRE